MAAGAQDEAAPDWAGLHVDLMQLIASWVLAAGGFLDYLRFRAVCTHWRASTASPRGRGLVDPRLHPRRWMLFPEGFGRFPGHRADGGHARFFDLSAAGVFVRVPIPELTDHCVLDSPDGLLLLQRDKGTTVHLLHPFTGDVAEFPSLDVLGIQLMHMEYEPENEASVDPWYFFNVWTPKFLHQSRKVCAAVSVTDEGVVSVMLALEWIGRVAFASAGSKSGWNISSWVMPNLDRALPYQGKLYVVNQEDRLTRIFVIDLPKPLAEGELWSSAHNLPPPRMVATCSSEVLYLPCLVELDSKIMLVGYKDSSFSRILVFKLDLVLGRTVPVINIGDHVLFSGARSLCVSSNWLPSIGANSIICFHAGENYLAQYHLSSGTWSPASDEHHMLCPPPRPCGLIHHIFTCCHRQFWNKGLMFCLKGEPEWPAEIRKSRIGA